MQLDINSLHRSDAELKSMLQSDRNLLINRRALPRNELTFMFEPLLESLHLILGPAIMKGYNQALKLVALKNIVFNLILYSSNGYAMAYSRNKNSYVNHYFYGQSYYTSTNYLNTIDSLIANGLVHNRGGFYDRDGANSYCSRLAPTEALLNLFQEAAAVVSYTSSERYKWVTDFSGIPCFSDIYSNAVKQTWYSNQVILKLPVPGHDKVKRLMDYRPTSKTLDYNTFLFEYNEFIQSIPLLYPDTQVVTDTYVSDADRATASQAKTPIPSKPQTPTSPGVLTTAQCPETSPHTITKANCCNSLLCKEIESRLYRVFNNGKFTMGGRFYGAGYQQLNSDQRSTLILDGSSVGEIDYSSFHTRMLYHLEGIDLCADPYDLYNGDTVMRDAVKLMLNMAINAKTEAKAIGAFNTEVFALNKPMPLKYPVNEVKAAKKAALNINILHRMKSLDIKARDILNRIKYNHKQIDKYICSGKGVELQFEDSQIAQRILMHFTSQGVPCLCVHDSFLVPEQHTGELEGVMREVYKDRFGLDCKLTRK